MKVIPRRPFVIFIFLYASISSSFVIPAYQSIVYLPLHKPIILLYNHMINHELGPGIYLDKHEKLRRLSLSDVDVKYSRSSGSGGQNVNKVSTKAEIRFNINKASETWLPTNIIVQLNKNEKWRINNDNVLIVTSTKHRTQRSNKQDAMEKLQAMIDEAYINSLPKKEPTIEKIKHIEKLKKKENSKRLLTKKMKGMKKQSRGKIRIDV